MSLTEFASALTNTLGMPVPQVALKAWETTTCPPADVLLAAEFLSRCDARGPAEAGRDLELVIGGSHLLVGYDALQEAMLSVVAGAEQYLTVTGSRSRDATYLGAIERSLADRPHLVHYRILYGRPRKKILVEHLERLLELRDPSDRSCGVKTLHLGIVEQHVDVPERFFVASERSAVVSIPSMTSVEAFDCGVLLAPEHASRLLDHGRQAYASARPVETRDVLHTISIGR